MFQSNTSNSAGEKFSILNRRHHPARLNTKEVAVILGFQEHDIAPMMVAKLLIPLGKPVSNATKYFALVDILELGKNRGWLSAATRTIANYWKSKNSRKHSSEIYP
jgi:ribosomal protein L33